MPTSPSKIGTSRAEALDVSAPTGLIVRRQDPDGRRAVARLAQQRGWRVTAVYEIGGDMQRRILADAHSGVFKALVVGSLSDLGSSPAAALDALLTLSVLNIVVESVAENWLSGSLAATAHVARWLDAANRQARVQKIKDSIARSGKRPGRPRRVVPVDEAQRLLGEGMSIGGAARVLGLPESTLRRALSEHRTEERLAALAAPTQKAEAA